MAELVDLRHERVRLRAENLQLSLFLTELEAEQSKHSGLRYQFKSIRVDFPEQILINEKDPAPHYVVRASIHAHNKP
ncbi:hypothetical protein EJB05_15580 [Eragrostis curvula]|uniref:Tetratricopeptide repeat protein 5 OB fold domain-containing protein n=1 Tax=Eragrostis curvula TaxID=38414 RepID=A0A5J9VCG1_9POAL|nr:hypothetical protein EJB05_15580 [Eragrostis curvula]